MSNGSRRQGANESCCKTSDQQPVASNGSTALSSTICNFSKTKCRIVQSKTYTVTVPFVKDNSCMRGTRVMFSVMNRRIQFLDFGRFILTVHVFLNQKRRIVFFSLRISKKFIFSAQMLSSTS